MADNQRFVIGNAGRLVPLKCATGEQAYALVDCGRYAELSQSFWRLWIGVRGNKYATMRKRKGQLMHRIISGADEGMSVDHINGNGLDNRLHNLRVCTHAENMRNQGPRNGRQYKGVYYNPKRLGRKKYQASIRVGYKAIHLGRFATEQEAVTAYDIAATRYHGEFARLNINSEVCHRG